MFEGTGIELEFSRELAGLHHESPEAAADCYGTKFGPVMLARQALGDRWPELRDELADLFRRDGSPSASGVVLPSEYLVIQGRKSGRSVGD